MAPGIDIEHEIDESAHSSDSPDNPSTFLRPSDSAFLHPTDAFLSPSADSATAFFHPSSAMFGTNPYEEETKPDLNSLSRLSSQSPPNTASGSTAFPRPSTSAGPAQASLSPGHPFGVMTPPGTAGGTPYVGSGKDPRVPGADIGAAGGRSLYQSEL